MEYSKTYDEKGVEHTIDIISPRSPGPAESIIAPSHGSINEKRLIRKIDLSILPILFCGYFLGFLDKVVYNYSNVMGMQKELGMHGNDYTWGATAFFIAYALAEAPQGMLLQRFHVGKVLGGNIMLWGVVTSCTAAVRGRVAMLALRTLLGVFESVITPALIILTTAWYQKDESALRFGYWFSGVGFGQIIGGLISFAAQHAPPGATFSGWRIMFVVVGIFNLIVGAIIFFWLPATPEEANFLNDAEKEVIAQRLYDDHAGTGVKVLRVRSILESFLDLQTWLLCLIAILNVIPSGVITSYSSILIVNFGFTAKEAALLNMPSGVVAIVCLLLSTWVITKGFPRWIAMIMALSATLLGACLMSFSPKDNHAALLAGIYLVNCAIAPFALILATAGANYRGYTRKICGGAILSAAFSIANIIGPQTFQAKDAPNYYPAKVTLVASTSAAIFVAILLRLLYGYRNDRAEKTGEPAMSHFESDTIRSRTSVDFADPGYRYVY